jgi:hypothetical protein
MMEKVAKQSTRGKRKIYRSTCSDLSPHCGGVTPAHLFTWSFKTAHLFVRRSHTFPPLHMENF